MSSIHKKHSAVWLMALIAVSAVIIFDARYHFDNEWMQAKIQHNSAQKNWHIFYSQEYVYRNSSLRYEVDFEQIKAIIEPEFVLISDMATSYYAATYLPVYIKNIHRHQGRANSPRWHAWLASNDHCYLELPDLLQRSREFFTSQRKLARARGEPELRYIIINKDRDNRLLRTDCFSVRSETLRSAVKHLAELKYDGQFLALYELL